MAKRRRKQAAKQAGTGSATNGAENNPRFVAGRFRPGQSGNPAGRPPRSASVTASLARFVGLGIPERFKANVKALFPELADEVDNMSVSDLVAMRLVVGAMGGELPFITTLMDRREGKAKQVVALTGDDRPPAELDDAEFADLIARATGGAGPRRAH